MGYASDSTMGQSNYSNSPNERKTMGSTAQRKPTQQEMKRKLTMQARERGDVKENFHSNYD